MNKRRNSLENAIRFGCGALLGAVLGISFSMNLFYLTSVTAISTCIMVCLISSGLLAVRYGDRYWESIGNWLR